MYLWKFIIIFNRIIMIVDTTNPSKSICKSREIKVLAIQGFDS